MITDSLATFRRIDEPQIVHFDRKWACLTEEVGVVSKFHAAQSAVSYLESTFTES